MKSMMRDLFPGLLVLLSAMPVAYLIYLINETFPNQPERAGQIVGGLFVFLFIIPPAVYLLFQRRSTNPGKLGLIILASLGVLLVSIYLYRVSFYIMFPADMLLWSESNFVNDILKLQLGYPIYSPEQNNESNIYTLGTQILTYMLALLLGNGKSIPIYRGIQIGYAFLTSVVAVFCWRRVIEMSQVSRGIKSWGLWSVVCLPIFFLMSTNFLTNPYTHALHNDALALLISVIAFWLLLEYGSSGDKRLLLVMAVLPGIGFFVKQSLAIWAPIYCGYLAFFQRPRSLVRVGIFALISFGFIGVVVAVCYMIWGEHFIYWVFTVLGKHPRSIFRSIKHIVDVWVYLCIGLVGGLLLLRGQGFGKLLGAWLIWLVLFILEAYTSGIAWMLNHMGPASVIGGIWFIAAMTRFWYFLLHGEKRGFGAKAYMRIGIAVFHNECALLRHGIHKVSCETLIR